MTLMRHAVTPTSLLVGLVALGGVRIDARRQVPLNIPDAERIDVPAGGVTVPTKTVGGRPTVEVEINGHGPFVMIVDTGATVTVVDPDLIAELHLPRALTDAIPASERGPLRIDALTIGTAVLHGVTVGEVGLLSGLGPNPPRGVLSAAAFPGHLVILDYPKATLRLERGALPPADNRQIFEYAPDERLPVVPVTVAGQPYRVHLDSGSPGALMLPTRDLTVVPLAGPAVDAGHARTVAGEFPISTAPFTGAAAIGEFPIALPTITFSDLRPGLAPGIGNIGAQILHTFVVTFDSANRRIRFARPTA
jgi:hypothetical protein